MERVNFIDNYSNTNELAQNLLEDSNDCIEACVSCIGKYETIKELLESLITLTDGSLEIDSIEIKDDENDYILTMCCGQCEIEVLEGYYVADILYIEGECSSNLLKRCESPNCLITDFIIE